MRPDSSFSHLRRLDPYRDLTAKKLVAELPHDSRHWFATGGLRESS